MVNSLIVIGSDSLGASDRDLGRLLMGNFLRNLADRSDLPDYIVLWNEGALLAKIDSPVLDHLKKLEENGVKVVVCRTCVDYFDIEGKMGAGEIEGIAGIIELLSKHTVLTV